MSSKHNVSMFILLGQSKEETICYVIWKYSVPAEA